MLKEIEKLNKKNSELWAFCDKLKMAEGDH
jgi:hypothetical protein